MNVWWNIEIFKHNFINVIKENKSKQNITTESKFGIYFNTNTYTHICYRKTDNRRSKGTVWLLHCQTRSAR